MKIIPFIQKFEKQHMNATLVIGALVGVGVGMFLFSLTVPEVNEMQKLNRVYSTKGSYTGFANRGGVMMVSSNSVPSQMMRSNFGITTTLSTDSVNSAVTNEKQFLSELIVQNENAIRLAHRVLSLTGISKSVTALAGNVITNKTADINTIRDLLVPETETKTTKTKK